MRVSFFLRLRTRTLFIHDSRCRPTDPVREEFTSDEFTRTIRDERRSMIEFRGSRLKLRRQIKVFGAPRVSDIVGSLTQ